MTVPPRIKRHRSRPSPTGSTATRSPRSDQCAIRLAGATDSHSVYSPSPEAPLTYVPRRFERSGSTTRHSAGGVNFGPPHPDAPPIKTTAARMAKAYRPMRRLYSPATKRRTNGPAISVLPSPPEEGSPQRPTGREGRRGITPFVGLASRRCPFALRLSNGSDRHAERSETSGSVIRGRILRKEAANLTEADFDDLLLRSDESCRVRVPQVGVLADLCLPSHHETQVSEYRDLWHPRSAVVVTGKDSSDPR